MPKCHQCGRRRATSTSLTGRALCSTCARQVAGQARSAAVVARGGGVGRVISGGRTARPFRGMYAGEAEAARRRREKLDATEGFWRRLWVRVVG